MKRRVQLIYMIIAQTRNVVKYWIRLYKKVVGGELSEYYSVFKIQVTEARSFFPVRFRHLWSCIYFDFFCFSLISEQKFPSGLFTNYVRISRSYLEYLIRFYQNLNFFYPWFPNYQNKGDILLIQNYSLITLDISPYTSLGLKRLESYMQRSKLSIIIDIFWLWIVGFFYYHRKILAGEAK